MRRAGQALQHLTSQSLAEVPRPTGVIVLGWLHLLIGIFGMSTGFLAFLVSPILGLVVVGAGVLLIYTGLGVLRAKRWMRTIVMIMYALGVIGDVLVIGYGGILTALGIAGIAVSGIVIYYLTRPHVKEYFGDRPADQTK